MSKKTNSMPIPEIENSALKPLIKKLVSNKLNLLIEGEAGTGKTCISKDTIREMNLKMKYFSAATMDPFADFVGIPCPETDDKGNKILSYHKVASIYEAEVLFFDELNRSHEKVRNALLEVIQFGTINDEPLPKVKAVIACINPDDGKYDVEPMDKALKGRFEGHVKVKTLPSKSWFKDKYGRIGELAVNWWKNDLNDDEKEIADPRTLEAICKLIKIDLNPKTTNVSLYHLPIERLIKMINQKESDKELDITDFVNDPEKYCELVEIEHSIAAAFMSFVKFLNGEELYATRMIFLSLPNEYLQALTQRNPSVFEKIKSTIISNDGKDEADIYCELFRDKLG